LNQNPEHLDLLRRAAQHHQSGRIEDAEALYHQVLAAEPSNVDALNLLGVIAFGRAQYNEAQAFYRRAIAAHPRVPDIHYNLGTLFAAIGEIDAALAAYSETLKLNPAFVGAHLGLGVEFYKRGGMEDAAGHFRAAVDLAPEDAAGYVNLGQCLLNLRRTEDAAACLQKAADLEPANAEVRLLLANAYADGDRLPEAITQIRRAIALDPRPQFYSTLGDLLGRAQDFEAAVAAHEVGLAAQPDDPIILFNFGATLHAAKRLADAEQMFQRALAENPNFIKAYIGLAKVYEHLGSWDRAIATLREALTRDPASADVRFKLSVLQLANGDLREGWVNYAYRMMDSSALHPPRATPPPYWSGEDLSGKTILIWTEQGVGDEIIYASMFNDVIARAGRCIIECSPRMAPVFARSFPQAQVLEFEGAGVAASLAHDAHFQIAAGDLGRFFRADFCDFPRRGGYLKADARRVAELRARYQSISRGNRIVGLAWRSSNRDIGAFKSADLKDWSALRDIPGVTFVNLQYGDCTAEIAEANASLGLNIVRDPDIDPLKNMDDFFAQVAAMDRVISTSNATVHVAGSLDVPVGLIDHDGPGRPWYWFRDRDSSPWYPSMRVFRHKFQGIDGAEAAWWRVSIDAASGWLRASS
jgi:tetratricopeptide (TPR) repeat protein